MKSFSKIIFLPFFLFACSSFHSEKKVCFKYENVSFTGRLESRPILNSKNYYWILLTAPFCTAIDADEELYQAFDNETEIHLSLNGYERFRHLLNKEVTVYGELFSAHTGHHKRNVILSVEKIEEKK